MRAFLYRMLLGNPAGVAKMLDQVTRLATLAYTQLHREIESNEVVLQEITQRRADLTALRSRIQRVLDAT